MLTDIDAFLDQRDGRLKLSNGRRNRNTLCLLLCPVAIEGGSFAPCSSICLARNSRCMLTSFGLAPAGGVKLPVGGNVAQCRTQSRDIELGSDA